MEEEDEEDGAAKMPRKDRTRQHVIARQTAKTSRERLKARQNVRHFFGEGEGEEDEKGSKVEKVDGEGRAFKRYLSSVSFQYLGDDIFSPSAT